MEIYDECESGKREIYQQFINAQHDVYHAPDMTRWLTRPAYIFRIEEVYDNCVTPEGFGNKMQYRALMAADAPVQIQPEAKDTRTAYEDTTANRK